MSGWMMRLSCLAVLGVISACSDPAPTPPAEDVAPLAWRPFSNDSPWNTPIPKDVKIDRDSAALIGDFAKRGGFYINMEEWSVPVYYIDMSETPKQAPIDLYPGLIGRGFEAPRAIPIPDGATPAGGTGYMAIVDKERHLEWDLRQAWHREDGLWFIGFGAVTNLRGTGVTRPWTQTESPIDAASALPSGFPLSAGLIRVDEIESGRISHALSFGSPNVRTDAFIPPASTALASGSQRPRKDTGLPLGARIQLDPAFDVENSGLSDNGMIIARALQEYGAYLADESGANTLFAESAPDQLEAWQGQLVSAELQAVFTPEMMAKNFRLVEMGDVLAGQPEDWSSLAGQ